MTKSVVIALIFFICIFVGFICNEFSIKFVKIAQKVDLATWHASGAACEGQMTREMH